MSGPVTQADAPPTLAGAEAPVRAPIEITASHTASVGGLVVRRALPMRKRRTVGSWCFVDHLGPVPARDNPMMSVGPHPHIGLQTVTWLVAGEAVHRDSLGSEVAIKPGQLNLMSAGSGVSHAEESSGYRGDLHAVQLWVAQPDATRHGRPSFEQLADLPEAELGAALATVLVGDFAGASSDARRDTDHMGAELQLRSGTTVLPLRADYEYAVVVLSGAVQMDDVDVMPGQLAYLGLGRDELAVSALEPARLLLLGGVPFESRVLMWWNFVARTQEEVAAATSEWNAGSDRFGETRSKLSRIDAPPVPWGKA